MYTLYGPVSLNAVSIRMTRVKLFILKAAQVKSPKLHRFAAEYYYTNTHRRSFSLSRINILRERFPQFG